jgi:Ca2+-binding RTX toxin-like protein
LIPHRARPTAPLLPYSIEKLEPRTLLTAAVGPDTYGYIANATPLESINLTPGDPNVTTLLTNTDDGNAKVSLGSNTFNFYGQIYTGANQLSVSENGSIAFQSSLASIAPLSDDWYGSKNLPSQVVSELDTTGGNDRLIIQWHVYHFSRSPHAITFQAILQLNTGDQPGQIIFNYINLNTGDSTNAQGANAVVKIDAGDMQNGHQLLISDHNFNPLIAGGSAILISNVITQRPHAVITVPQNIEEGMTILEGSASTDPTDTASALTYAWDLDGDGKYGETGQDASFGGEVGISPTFSSPALANDTIFPISLRVTDSAGLISYAFATVNVHHIPPQLNLTPPSQLFASVPARFSLSAGPVSTWFDYSINWGDSASDDFSDNGAARPIFHTFDQPGTYTISATATDGARITSAPFTLQVTIAARPIQLLTNSGTLILTTDDTDNSINITESGSNFRVNLNNVITTSPLTAVKSLDIQTGNGNNLIDADVNIPQSITASEGNDTITTGDAADTISSTGGNDSITSNGGDNLIIAQAGFIQTSDGNDTIYGGDGGLTISAGNGNDSIITGAGNDSILDGNGDDYISAGDGNDTVVAMGDSTTDSGATIQGDEGDDYIGGVDISGGAFGGDGNDIIRIHSDPSHPALVFGGDGNDKIFTTDGRDTLYGEGGSDSLYAGNGNDFLSGGAGSDHLFGQGGNDRLFGDSGYDHLNGQGGNDTLSGGPSPDHLNGGAGNNAEPHDDPLDDLLNIQTDLT